VLDDVFAVNLVFIRASLVEKVFRDQFLSAGVENGAILRRLKERQ
jgi:hypothetical protein